MNHSGVEHLRDTLEAVLAQQPAASEVLLVDSGSDDASIDIVKAHYASVRVIARLCQPLGKADQRTAACRHPDTPTSETLPRRKPASAANLLHGTLQRYCARGHTQQPVDADAPAWSEPARLHGAQLTLLAIAIVAAIGGAVNSIAGGGTLLTFPSLIALGIPPIVANATSTVALWPGALSSMWGYRRQLAGARAWAIRFAVPSLAGGLAGALLLLNTPAERFAMLVPWLVLGATLLFMAQGPVMRQLRIRRGLVNDTGVVEPLLAPPASFLIWQFLIGIYGGYFGAGVGILMLASLGMMGLVNIHRMNGLKNWGGMCMNAVAAVTFAITGLVNWPVALAMAVGAMAGGYAGARLAQLVPQTTVRKAIIAIGLLSTVWLAFGR